MKAIPQTISDLILIEPTIHVDERGYFLETYRQDYLAKIIGEDFICVQENVSKSSKGVLRGMHYQLPPFSQSKLIRVIEGKILDVAIDIRKSSKTFGQHIALELSAENNSQLFVPRGFAHGFVALAESATIVYKVDNFYAPSYERGIIFDDKDLNIDWQLPSEMLNLSHADQKHSTLANTDDLFE